MRSRKIATIVTLAISSLVAVACSHSSSGTEVPQWKLCGAIECSDVAVPLDWQKPHGTSISIRVVRHRAQLGSDRLGVLIVNPGGPGIPGSTVVSNAPAFLSPDIIRRFDVVSWDPRGTGDSHPKFQCDISSSLGLIDTNTAFEAQRSAVSECKKLNPQLFSHMSTQDSARDLNAIRLALGEETVSFLGYSYGGYLGAMWSHLFPTTVRAIVLDAPPAPKRNWKRENESFASRVDSIWRAFQVQHKTTVTSQNEQTLARAVVATVTSSAGQQQLLGAMQSPRDLHGQLQMLWNAYLYITDNSDPQIVTAQYATQCSDEAAHAPISSPELYSGSKPSDVQKIVLNTFVCGLWPTTSAPASYNNSMAPALVIGATKDAITPLANAQHFARVLRQAHLLTVESSEHTSYTTNACATREVDQFLTTLSTELKSVCR